MSLSEKNSEAVAESFHWMRGADGEGWGVTAGIIFPVPAALCGVKGAGRRLTPASERVLLRFLSIT